MKRQETKAGTKSRDPAGRLRPRSILDGKFEIAEFVTSGGMGFIYRARQLSTARMVAVKVMRALLSSDQTAVRRFSREAWAISQLHHQNTVRLLDYGTSEDGFLYLAMEWLEGHNVARVVARRGPLAPVDAARVGAEVARSLVEAHGNGIIHRDLKPENVILVETGSEYEMVKVLDFGIAKLMLGEADEAITMMGTVCGTPEYMSPEQARAENLDGRSDIYGLGCLLFTVLTGRPPFTNRTKMRVVQAHLRKPFPSLPSEVPSALSSVIYRATQKNLEDRFQSAEEMAVELETFMALHDASGANAGMEEEFDDPTGIHVVTPHAFDDGARSDALARLSPLASLNSFDGNHITPSDETEVTVRAPMRNFRESPRREPAPANAAFHDSDTVDLPIMGADSKTEAHRAQGKPIGDFRPVGSAAADGTDFSSAGNTQPRGLLIAVIIAALAVLALGITFVVVVVIR